MSGRDSLITVTPRRGSARGATARERIEARGAFTAVGRFLPELAGWSSASSGRWSNGKLRSLQQVHPLLHDELHTGNELASLTRRDVGIAVGVVPLFLAEGRSDLVRLTEPLDDGETELWLLTHPESRHLRRVGVVYSHLAQTMNMP